MAGAICDEKVRETVTLRDAAARRTTFRPCFASAAFHRVHFLLTWNCKHIANPVILPRVYRVIDDFSLPFPVICTPQDMLDSDEDAH